MVQEQGEITVTKKSKFTLPEEKKEEVSETKEVESEAFNADTVALSLVKKDGIWQVAVFELDSSSLKTGKVELIRGGAAKNEAAHLFKLKASELFD